MDFKFIPSQIGRITMQCTRFCHAASRRVKTGDLCPLESSLNCFKSFILILLVASTLSAAHIEQETINGVLTLRAVPNSRWEKEKPLPDILRINRYIVECLPGFQLAEPKQFVDELQESKAFSSLYRSPWNESVNTFVILVINRELNEYRVYLVPDVKVKGSHKLLFRRHWMGKSESPIQNAIFLDIPTAHTPCAEPLTIVVWTGDPNKREEISSRKSKWDFDGNPYIRDSNCKEPE